MLTGAVAWSVDKRRAKAGGRRDRKVEREKSRQRTRAEEKNIMRNDSVDSGQGKNRTPSKPDFISRESERIFLKS